MEAIKKLKDISVSAQEKNSVLKTIVKRIDCVSNPTEKKGEYDFSLKITLLIDLFRGICYTLSQLSYRPISFEKYYTQYSRKKQEKAKKTFRFRSTENQIDQQAENYSVYGWKQERKSGPF